MTFRDIVLRTDWLLGSGILSWGKCLALYGFPGYFVERNIWSQHLQGSRKNNRLEFTVGIFFSCTVIFWEKMIKEMKN